ncbi:ribonuclease H-like domain-containing protein [Tanacetum coccineum]
MITRSQSGIVKPIDRLYLNTFLISPIPKNPSDALKDPIGHKFHPDGTLSCYKARLVTNGSSQQLGVDFDETFSPVVKPATILTVLSLVVSHKWLIHQLNGSQVAYLLLYVDDIILTASSTALLQHLIDSLHREFNMTDLGALNYFLGISTVRHSTGLGAVDGLDGTERGYQGLCYDGNPNNMNGWIEADVPLLGELGRLGEPLGVEVDEPMVNPMIDELAEPIVEVEE